MCPPSPTPFIADMFLFLMKETYKYLVYTTAELRARVVAMLNRFKPSAPDPPTPPPPHPIPVIFYWPFQGSASAVVIMKVYFHFYFLAQKTNITLDKY